MSEFASFLALHMETLVQQWTQRAAEHVVPEVLSEPARRGQGADILRELVTSLERGTRPETVVSAREHGGQRYRLGFPLDALMREYDVLRNLLFDLAEKANLARPLPELRLVTDFLAQALVETVSEYEQQQTEQVVRSEAESAEQRQHELFMQSPAAIALLDGPEYLCTFANPPYRALVNRPDVVGKTRRELLPDGWDQGFDDELSQVMATGEPFAASEMPVRLRHQVGNGLRYLNFTYTPRRDAAGAINGVMVAVIDMTEQVMARRHVEGLVAQVRQSEERLRLIVEASGIGTWELDPSTNLLVADERFRTVYGFSPEAPLSLEQEVGLIHPEDQNRLVNLLTATLTGQLGGRYQTDYRVVQPHDGQVRWLENRGQAFFDADGKPVRFLGTVADITERKSVELEREQLVEELTRRNQALDEFAHVASHDLKAPLRGIANLAEWIEDDLGDALTSDVRDKLHLMRGRIRHLERLITSLLDFATAGRVQGKPEVLEPRKLLTEVVELLDPPTTLTIALGDPMPSLVGERVALQQVLMNLVGNAIKHAERTDAVIRVEGKVEGTFIHFSVADNGPGIAPKDQARIWGLFQKLSTSKKAESTGIGLAVVKKAVESRGGRVWVESEQGQGATFHVLWPRSMPGDVPEPPPSLPDLA